MTLSAVVPQHTKFPRPTVKTMGLVAAIASALLTGACSGGLDLASSGDSMQTALAPESAVTSKSELKKALEYWGKEYKEKPRDLKVALSYAKNLKAAGEKQQAFGVLQSLALLYGDNKELASEYGRLALDLGQTQVAHQVLMMADDPANPDWRVISAIGTVHAKQGKYAEAIQFYERALSISPSQSSVLNNLAMAHAASGEPDKAEDILRRLLADDTDGKIRQNLTIVLGLQNKHDEARRLAGEAGLPQQVVDENSDYMRQMVKAPVASMAPVAQARPAAAAKKLSGAWITTSSIATSSIATSSIKPAKPSTAEKPVATHKAKAAHSTGSELRHSEHLGETAGIEQWNAAVARAKALQQKNHPQ